MTEDQLKTLSFFVSTSLVSVVGNPSRSQLNPVMWKDLRCAFGAGFSSGSMVTRAPQALQNLSVSPSFLPQFLQYIISSQIEDPYWICLFSNSSVYTLPYLSVAASRLK